MQRRTLLFGLSAMTLTPDKSAGEPDLAAQVATKARLAVEQFQVRAGGRLDYTAQSLSKIEEMLAEAAEHRASLDASTTNALVQLAGSYVLETAHREFGGSFAWYEPRRQPVLVVGEPVFHVAIVAFDRVRGRLSGDTGDNIPFFYQGFAERVRSATPGTKALYV